MRQRRLRLDESEAISLGGHRTPGVIRITEMTCSSAQHYMRLESAEGGISGVATSTIEEVRATEKKVQEVLDALKKASAQDPHHLSVELQKATDEYARAVRELQSK